VAAAESAAQIELSHLFRACVHHAPDLVIAALVRAGCDAQDARSWTMQWSAPAAALPEAGAKLPLSPDATSVVVRARERAGGAAIDIHYLWESVQGALPLLAGWLAA